MYQSGIAELVDLINTQRAACNCPSVLIVDDDEFIRIGNKLQLVEIGLIDESVGNGQLAVEAVLR